MHLVGILFPHTILTTSRSVTLAINVSDKSCRENQNTFCVQQLFFSKNRAVYEILCKNTVQLDRTQVTIWRMRIACWIPKATNTHPKYVIRIVFPLQPTGHLGTGFSRFRCVYKRMLRWFPSFQVATACFSCSPPDLNFLDPYFIFMYMQYNHFHRAKDRLQFGQRPELSQSTGIALVRCILGKFLGVVCHCFPPRLDVPTFATRCLNDARDLAAEGGTVGENVVR